VREYLISERILLIFELMRSVSRGVIRPDLYGRCAPVVGRAALIQSIKLKINEKYA
jgi:hypothetical protein